MNNHTKLFHNDIHYSLHADTNPVIYPIVTSSTYKIFDVDEVDNQDFTYSRSENPTRSLLEDNLAILENAKYALTFASGLGALTCVSTLKRCKGGVIAGHDLYGGTKRYFNTICNNPIQYIDFNELSDDELEDLFKTDNKVIWLETPTNPLLDIIDIKKLSLLKEKYNKTLIVDNTFMSPIFQKPLILGADLIVHSVTKYINGMSDVVMGCIMTNDKSLYDELKYLQNAMGIVPGPFDCYLVNRSVKTLKIRMKKHEKNALKIAKMLEQNPHIEKVIYPGLESYKYKDIADQQMYGYGGMITFIVKKNTKEFLNSLKLVPVAESLGGVESLMCHPARMTHSSLDKEELDRLGINEDLVRLSVGLEHYRDIYDDIEQALEVSNN